MNLLDDTLLGNVVSILWTAINQGYTWLNNLVNATGVSFTVLLVSIVGTFSLYKYIISPFMAGKSDRAKRKGD